MNYRIPTVRLSGRDPKMSKEDYEELMRLYANRESPQWGVRHREIWAKQFNVSPATISRRINGVTKFPVRA
jgi:hypothetical protein